MRRQFLAIRTAYDKMEFNSKIFKIKESVDVYTIEDPSIYPDLKIQFYRINTRERISIQINPIFSRILSSLDGYKSLTDIFNDLRITPTKEDTKAVFEFLIEEGIVIEISSEKILDSHLISRYSRQINYFDDLIPDTDGYQNQIKLLNKKVVIIGCGAVGSAIAIHLARSGVCNFTLVDYKIIDKSNIARHLYVNKKSVGKLKTDELKNYLVRINSKSKIKKIDLKITPKTNLDEIIPSDTDIVINSADEPYIGHITIKIGRYLWNKNIGLYVAGGFDAHLMSTGELIFKGLSPCADCCSMTFRKALSSWKPTYASGVIYSEPEKDSVANKKYVIGGSGGTSAQSLFSASFGSINIINFLLGNYPSVEFVTKRGEYLIDKGIITWFNMEKQNECIVCSA
jgi:tRNA A37 threonylcarbamoyladenosine dehydratase